VDIGFLEEDYSSEWASCRPSFTIPKKNGTIRVITNFRKLKLLSNCHPFPIPKIEEDMIRSMEDFTFVIRSESTMKTNRISGILDHQTRYSTYT
jgi:hypothetical protein